MIAPTSDQVKVHKSYLGLWMQLKGFQLINKQWIAKSRCALVTPLLNGYVSIQVGVPA